jgi:hypothetical protein
MRASLLMLALSALALATTATAAQPLARRPDVPGDEMPKVSPVARPQSRPSVRHRPGHHHHHRRPHRHYGPRRWDRPWWYRYHRHPHDWRGGYDRPWNDHYRQRVPFANISYPYGMNTNAGDPWEGEGGEYGSDSYLYPYDTTGYYSGMEIYSTRVPYYEADPVQYAYAPADIPPRAAVVRPPRTSPAALIVPGAARAPLYSLVAAERPSSVTAHDAMAAR